MPVAHLVMPSMKWPYALGTHIAIGGNTNNMSPSKDGGKCLTSQRSMLLKSIIVRSYLILFLDFVTFNASTIFKLEEDEK